MKLMTPEISWHNREPVFGVDVQKRVDYDEGDLFYRIATCGSDNFVAIWRAYRNKSSKQSTESKSLSNHITSNQSNKLEQIDGDVSDLLNSLLDQSTNAVDVENSFKIPFVNNVNQEEKPKSKRLIDLECVATLNMHIKAVNVAKFAPVSNLLASGSDDQYIYIYEYKGILDPNNENDKDRCNPFNEFDDSIIAKEHWKRISTLRRHINDVVDLAWSPDEKFLITGSVDNISYVWDVKKGDVLYELSKHAGYVQGVAWDPLNNLIATLCTDRNLRIFTAPTSERSKKSTLVHRINKLKMNQNEEKNRNSSLFYDDTLATISRRMCFSPNGELLACPSGIIDLDESEEDGSNKFINCLHMFYRGDNFKKLHCYFPTGVYTNSIQFCQRMFKLNPDLPNPYPFPYRLVFAIAAKDKILIYDTQQVYPIAKISDIHYTRISDLSWTVDGQMLLASSTDGFCTFVYFNENELGERYEGEPYRFETVEAKKQSNSNLTATLNNKKGKVTVDEVLPKENLNLSSEKTPQPKIINFFKKAPTPLLPTKLTNSFEKVSDEPKVKTLEDDSNDCQLIKEIINKDEKRKIESTVNTTTESKVITTKTSKPIVNSIQHLLKKKPSQPANSLTSNGNMNSTSISQPDSVNKDCNANLNETTGKNESSFMNLPQKRGPEHDTPNQAGTKKRAKFITIPQ